MATRDHEMWVSRGSPFRLMLPAADLRQVLVAQGYPVLDVEDRHLDQDPPGDHTPYSRAGFPDAAIQGVGYAIDVLPPPPGSALPPLTQLGAQILADRNSGVPGICWLKQLDWEPDGDNGPCHHESWERRYARREGHVRGHLHLSGLTGYEDSTVGEGYDPVARLRHPMVSVLESAR